MQWVFQSFTEENIDDVEFGNITEREAVLQLKNELEKDDRIDQDYSFIVPKFRLEKSARYDLETVLFLRLKKTKWDDSEIENLLFIIEVKSHSEEDIRFEENSVKVKYHSCGLKPNWKNAYRQARENMFSLFTQIQGKLAETQLGRCRWVYYLLFFPNISFELLRTTEDYRYRKGVKEMIDKYILCGDTVNLEYLVQRAVNQWISERRKKKAGFIYRQQDGSKKLASIYLKDKNNYFKLQELFRDEYLKMRSCDRRKLDKLTHRKISINEHVQKLEENRFLVLKGGSGTGKSITLLEMAFEYAKAGEKVLLTTYNIVLANDLRRLKRLYFSHVDPDLFISADKNIEIANIDQLIAEWARYAADFLGVESEFLWDDTGFLLGGELDYEQKYESRKEIINRLCREFSNDIEEIRSLLGVLYDYIFIDEAQDWDDGAFRILRKLAKQSCKFVLVDSEDQRLQPRRLSFLDSGDFEPHYHRTDYRHFKGIDFFARSILAPNLSYVRKNEYTVPGLGEIDIVPDKNLGASVIKKLLWELKKDKADPSDLLIIEPDCKRIKEVDGVDLIELMENEDICVWNAHKYSVKRMMRYMNDAVRILDYESSRGLEAWIVVMRLADVAYDRSYEMFSNNLRNQENFGYTEGKIDRESRSRARRLLYIAASRAVKKLIVTYSDKDHPIIKEMFEIRDRIFARDNTQPGQMTAKSAHVRRRRKRYEPDDLPF